MRFTIITRGSADAGVRPRQRVFVSPIMCRALDGPFAETKELIAGNPRPGTRLEPDESAHAEAVTRVREIGAGRKG